MKFLMWLWIIGIATSCAAETEMEAVREDLTTQTLTADKRLSLNYFAIFYGPSLRNPSRFQPDATGTPDPNRPLLWKNFINLGYALSDQVAITGTAYWNVQAAGRDTFQLQDPFVRVSKSSLYQAGPLNLYGDIRAHFPVTSLSRENDLLFGLQAFNALQYDFTEARLGIGLFGSVRGNIYGRQGYGNDFEFYLAPNVNYTVSSKVSLTLLYEIMGSHAFGSSFSFFKFDGTDIEPGVSWDVTPQLTLNPYIHIVPDKNLGLASTTIGMLLSYTLL